MIIREYSRQLKHLPVRSSLLTILEIMSWQFIEKYGIMSSFSMISLNTIKKLNHRQCAMCIKLNHTIYLPCRRKSSPKPESGVQLITIVILYNVPHCSDSLCVLVGGCAPQVVKRGRITGVPVTSSEVDTDHKVQFASSLRWGVHYLMHWMCTWYIMSFFFWNSMGH